MECRALRGEQAQLAEEIHLVEEEVLGLQRVPICRVDRGPAEIYGTSRRRDITIRRAEHSIMGAPEGPFGRRGRRVDEELLNLKAEIWDRVLEHREEADDDRSTTGLTARRHQLGVCRPGVSVAITIVDGVYVLQDHVRDVGHQFSPSSLWSPPSQKTRLSRRRFREPWESLRIEVDRVEDLGDPVLALFTFTGRNETAASRSR